MSKAQTENFFIVGGTLGGNASSYVQRPLDDDLLRLTLSGEYCNVLAARQMGKSSLMVRTAARLREQGTRVAIIDTTSIGSSVTSSEWYFGLISRLARELKLAVNEQAWWETMSSKSPVQRFSDFLRDVVLEEIQDPIVIFVDEIDSTLKLNFTDDFFAAIRATYNARSVDEAYKRLTFVLLGVARPGDLIKDRTRTPYNIGVNVDVTDFEISELGLFQNVLEEYFPKQGRDILQWVLGWTGGQPYLTQKLCSEIIGQDLKMVYENKVDSLVEQLFLSDRARTETNLRSIRDRISNNPYVVEMLRVYRRVLAGKQIVAEERSIAHNELKITGLVKVSDQGYLQIRNRIYEKIFDENWAKNSIPANMSNRRLITAISSVAVLAIAFAGYFYYRQQNQAVEIQAQTYIDNFNTSTSQEVQITSLAGLFELGGEYEAQAKVLFTSLPFQDQQALFELATPENVGNELVVVVDGVYQDIPDTQEGNTLLSAMAGALEQSNATGAASLVIEINDWLAGRDALAQEQYEVAVVSFTRAWDRSEQRSKPNLGVLLERASAYTASEQYDNALSDLETGITQNPEKRVEVQGQLFGNEGLLAYFRANPGNYPNITSVISIPTPAATETPSRTPVPTVGVGSSRVSSTDGGVEMFIPTGSFQMGSDFGPLDEQPIRSSYTTSFWIDQTEVTNAMYALCRTCEKPDNVIYFDDPLYANHPVVFVDRRDAEAYCSFTGGRLPTDVEWEKAARGGLVEKKYPWGDEDPTCGERALNGAYFASCGGSTTTEVGSFASNGYGLYDMAGNVWEWINNNVGDDRNTNLRGGAWNSQSNELRSANRFGYYFTNKFPHVGFRCVRNP